MLSLDKQPVRSNVKTKAYVLAMVTAPSLKTARRLAKSALMARLTACVNLVPRIESHYWWRGQIETGQEVLMIFKTTSRSLELLEKLIISEHPYDTPEFIVLQIAKGNKRYLSWLGESVF